MKCDSCLHKEICTHRLGIQNGTYGAMRYNFDTEECTDYAAAADVAPVVHGQIIWRERHRGGFKTVKCLHCFNDINIENNIPCKHIAKIDGRYTNDEPYCSNCGKLLGDFMNYCGNCGAKMDGDKNEQLP